MEATFAADSYRKLLCFAERQEGEFIKIGTDVLDSEELSELIYQIYLTLITDGWTGNKYASLDDIGAAYLNGFYVPCCERWVLAGQIDLTNDELPDHAGIVLPNSHCLDDDDSAYISLRRVDRFPQKALCPPFTSARYVQTLFWEPTKHRERNERRRINYRALDSFSSYFAVMPSGSIIPCPPADRIDRIDIAKLWCQLSAAAINGINDRRHIWNVSTSEPIIWQTSRTPLMLGVSPEHVKSLFYARSLPVTESGRKRPILHWVQSHQRRIKAGIDINIERYLRGISSFEMDGFAFEITSPRKREKP